MIDDLIEVARRLATMDVGRPRQASLRRAVSTAYYALFHALCDACVASLIGWKRRPRSWTSITSVYRSVDHGAAKRVSNRLLSRPESGDDLQKLATALLFLQEARIRADYDPHGRFAREEVLLIIERAATAVERLRALSPEHRLDPVVQLVTKQR